VPPVPTGRAYATLVPTTDQDGIDIAGIKLPDIAVPIGTYTGWSTLARAPKDECSAMGSFIPFALTKAERVASCDPRLSLEERYSTHSRYIELVREASERLVAERLLLQEDAEAFIKLAEERDLGLPR
jgi:Alpha/beta hydrolase domain